MWDEPRRWLADARLINDKFNGTGHYRMSVSYLHGSSPDALSGVADGSVAAIVCDPPYGTAAPNVIYGRRHAGAVNHIQNDTDLRELRATAPTMMRILSRFGVAMVFAAPTERTKAVDAIEAGGLRVVAVISWDKGRPGISYRVRYSHEDIIIAAQHGAGDPFDSREPIVSPIRVPPVRSTEHPNEKPVLLYRKLIRWATNGEGGLIVDPFAGIASCGVGAVAEKCDYFAVECDKQWWPIGERRLAEAQNHRHPDIEQDSLFGDVA